MQRKSLITALVAGLGLAGAIAYASNRDAIAPLVATPTPDAAEPLFDADAPVAFTTVRTDPVRTATRPAAAPTDAQVGDAASFGRNMRWLGMSASPPALVSNDCAAVHTADPSIQWQQINDYAVDTAFASTDLGKIELPAGATNSMLCHWLTPFMQGNYYSTSSTPTVGRIAYAPNITIESPVLADPSMINPLTGTPFNGRIQRSASYEIENGAATGPAAAIGCLPPAQRDLCGCADQQATTARRLWPDPLAGRSVLHQSHHPLRFGVSGSTRNVGRVLFRIGARVVGD